MTSRTTRVRAAAWLGAWLATAAAAAPPTYEGTLAAGATVTGLVGGSGWIDETAEDVDFWRMVVPEGGRFVTLRGVRGDAGLDLVFSLFHGTTTADASLYRSESDWGGLSYLATADDEVPSAGPGGDPLYRSPLLAAGEYTVVIGGFLSAGQGPYAYSLSAAAVPEPATALLTGFGAAALALATRRRRSAAGGVAGALQGPTGRRA